MSYKFGFIAINTTKRTKILAEYLDAKIISSRISTNLFIRFIQYPIILLLMFIRLFVRKFDVIFVQIPPIHCALIAFYYCKLLGKKIIFDTHSGIFFYKGLHQKLYLKLYCYLIKKINLNIVHNEDILNNNCFKKNNTIVLEDKLSFDPTAFISDEPRCIGIITSFGKDEPIDKILIAAERLPHIKFYMTGDYKKIKKKNLPKNIYLTGYLSDIEYEDLLRQMNILMVLTNRTDTVLCGAYEAVSLAKPLITSDTITLKKYFNKGTIHTANNSEEIIQAINNAIINYPKLYQEMLELRNEKEKSWEIQYQKIEKLLK